MFPTSASSSCLILKNFGLAIALIPFTLLAAASESLARTIHASRQQPFPAQGIVFNSNFEPPGDGAPRDTVGAGSRDGTSCSPDEPSISALLPEQSFGLTQAAQPTIQVQLPNTSAEQIALVVQNEAGTYYERTFLPIPTSDRPDGLVSFTFPKTISPLTVGENYQWKVVVICGETVQPDDPVLSGWLQRAPLAPGQQLSLNQQTVVEQALWYAQHGYWYELVEALRAELRSQPNNPQLQALWQSLLNNELVE